MRQTILTGDRPTGPLHLGHFIGSLKQRVALQKEHDQFILIADVQALTDNMERPEKVKENIIEVALDYLAMGIDPGLSTIVLQSSVPALWELTAYYMNLVTINRLQRNPTVKEEVRQKKFKNHIPVGFFCYPISQAADITAFKATLVPVGNDQLPMIELATEIVRRFNRIYEKEVLVEPKAELSATGRLMGIDGKAKMSKSLNNAIYIKDNPDIVWEKIKQMYTDPNHLRVEDPGQVEGNIVFMYLDAFDPDKKKLEEMKAHYQRGGLGDMKVKRHLYNVLMGILEPMHERRKEWESDLPSVWDMIKKGTFRANEVTQQTLKEVKEVMRLYDFSNTMLIK